MNPVEYALSMLGKPYRWGGTSPFMGFDCSGFCQEVLRAYGVLNPYVDHSASALKDEISKNGISMGIQKGAIAFFGVDGKITHAGFCINEYQMIEFGGGDSTTVSAEIAHKQGAFGRLRPVKLRKDFVTAITPKYPDWAWKELNG